MSKLGEIFGVPGHVKKPQTVDLEELSLCVDTSKAVAHEGKPPKVAQLTPNHANAIEWRLAPLLALMPVIVRDSTNVWVSGSRVSSLVLGVPCAEDADLDLFAAGGATYAAVLSAFQADPTVREITSRAASNKRGVGFKVEFLSGLKVDVWHEVDDPIEQLGRYPSDGYAHVRMAYNPSRRALIVVANEVA